VSAPVADGRRVVSDLRELARLTGGPGGAGRVAWSDGWRRARQWLTEQLAELSCEVTTDPAGNLLADLPGEAGGFVMVGSHIDSVPAGGWLDGVLGVLSALEVLRAWAEASEPPPVGLRLVDWADEEGARYGRSLFGSSTATGLLDPMDYALLVDVDGVSFAEAASECGVDLATASGARRSLDGAHAYLELHIEQGPVLERTGRRVAVVTGTAGVRRRTLHLTGEAAHAGAAPMDMRRDPVLAAGRIVGAAADLAVERGGTATFGSIAAHPGIVTIVAERCDVVIDLRHPQIDALSGLVDEVDTAVANICNDAGVRAEFEPQWSIDPIPFDPRLIDLARAACTHAGLEPAVMASGALHDAAPVAELVPTVMLFTPSRRGISHSPTEDTDEADLIAGVKVLGALASSTLEWAARQQ
jgi:N-carbamoyl-L-amino-acid hydrolase